MLWDVKSREAEPRAGELLCPFWVFLEALVLPQSEQTLNGQLSCKNVGLLCGVLTANTLWIDDYLLVICPCIGCSSVPLPPDSSLSGTWERDLVGQVASLQRDSS